MSRIKIETAALVGMAVAHFTNNHRRNPQHRGWGWASRFLNCAQLRPRRVPISALEFGGREDLNLRPPGPELWKYKLPLLYLASLRDRRTHFSLAQLCRSCTEPSKIADSIAVSLGIRRSFYLSESLLPKWPRSYYNSNNMVEGPLWSNSRSANSGTRSELSCRKRSSIVCTPGRVNRCS
jgi:hypothetical protein